MLVLVLLLAVPTGLQAAGWFAAANETEIPPGAIEFAVGELNGDAFPDVVVGYDNVMRVYFSNGEVGFDPGPEILSPDASWAPVVADFNGDGNFDLAASDFQQGPQRIHYGDGEGGFPTAEEFYAIPQGTKLLRAADLDGDGFDDLVIPSSFTLRIAWGSSTGMAVDPMVFDFGLNTPCQWTIGWDVNIVDTEGVGRFDIIVLFSDDDSSCNEGRRRGIARFRNLGNRQFGAVEFLVVDNYYISDDFWYEFDSGDLDGDGDMDFVVAGNFDTGIVPLIKTGPGSWDVHEGSGFGVDDLVADDFDGDGVLDVALESWIFRGNGDATFEWVTSLSDYIGDGWSADLDNDGDPDIVGLYGNANRLYAFSNEVSNPTAVPVSEPPGVSHEIAVTPSVVRPGGRIEFGLLGEPAPELMSGGFNVIDASGRIAARISSSVPGSAKVAWSVPETFPSGRYWVRSEGGPREQRGSFVVVR